MNVRTTLGTSLFLCQRRPYFLHAQRYVRYGYESDSCRALDQDGECLPEKPEKRLHFACVTVGLETQVLITTPPSTPPLPS